jgi:hypothetical protein
LLIFLLAISAPAFALYGSNSKVVKLTAANFREKVLNSNQLWFVEFYGKFIFLEFYFRFLSLIF